MAGVRVTNRKGFAVLSDLVGSATEAALEEVAAVAEGEIKERMTKDRDSRGFPGRVQSGNTRQATYADEPHRDSNGLSVEITVHAPQETPGIIIEKGRKPGKGVSRQGQRMIERWARRKLGPVKAEGGRFKPGGRPKAERSRAFLIARAIKRRGIPALRPFHKAAEHLRRGLARRVFQKAIDRAVKRGGKA